MRKPKIKLITNVPCVFTLESNSGKESSSQFSDGVEYMYSVVCQGEESILYLPVDGELAIRRSGAQAGDEVQLTKTMQNNRAVFTVRIFSDAHLAVPTPPPAMPRAYAPAPRPVETPGVRMLAPQSQIAPAPHSVAPIVHEDGNNTALAKRCFTAAIDVLAHAKAYGQEKYAMPLNFNEEDVRALGISFLIGAQKGGR